MAIHNEQIAEVSGGFSKVIDKGAEAMIYDLLQKHQYQYPIRSTVRELASNGLDATKERDVARSILQGKSKVEDHFIEREGDLYKDSKFDPTYYDINFLGTQTDIEIIYRDGGETGKDTVIIRDNGVGLGGKRLAGYFNLGFSTKRLNKFTLGKFGLGAKSPLSTGCAYYTLISRHNGREFHFNIYDHKVESLVPKFDLDRMIEHESTFLPGYVDALGEPIPVYYKRTGASNGVEVILPVKKHHKQQYLDAVKSQLLYFPNVRCLEEDVYGRTTAVEVKANILYEDKHIVLANNSAYSKPHLLLNGVNYGYIDFTELELEEKLGNIGIKVDPDKVSINPSRESLIWDDVTRQVVVDKFNEVVGIASEQINEQLKETDLIKWMRICASLTGSWGSDGNNPILSRLSKIVDMSKIEGKFGPDPRFSFNYNLLGGLHASSISLKTDRKGSKIIKKVDYSPGWMTSLRDGLPLLLLKDGHSNRRNKYLLSHVYPQGFVAIKLNGVPEDGGKVTEEMIEETNHVKEAFERWGYKETKERLVALQNLLMESSEALWLDDIQVPEDFKGTDEKEEEEEQETVSQEALLSAEERRKLTGSTVLHTPRIRHDLSFDRYYETQKFEVPIVTVDSWNNEEIFWSNQNYEPLLHTAALITRPEIYAHKGLNLDLSQREKIIKQWKVNGYTYYPSNHQVNDCAWFMDDEPLRLIKVAQDNTKYYRDFKHITRFFKEIRNKTITMSNALIRWNTARLLQERIEDLRFLNGFKQIDQEKAIQYQRIKGYVDKYFREIRFGADETRMGAEQSTTQQIISHLDKVGAFQLFVREHPDEPEAIAQLAQQYFNPQAGVEIVDGGAIDLELYDMYQQLLDWSAPVKDLLNMVNPLINGGSMTNQQEEEIRNYFRYRNCPL